ncbi:MAG: zinc-ribbon domain-containing protein [Candidatus Bathyarchaeia archaeon]
MPYCPNCGSEVDEDQRFCPKCGYDLDEERMPRRRGGAAKGAGEHLSTAFNIATSKPMVFVPTLIGGVISSIIGWLSAGMGYGGYRYSSGLVLLGALFSIAGGFFTYILSFASIDMSRDAYLNRPLDLGESINYVLSRFLTFLIASIVGALMSITIILIPVVILMFVIIVMDETGIGDAIGKAFSVLRRDLGDIILILLVSIIGSAILGYLPFTGILNAVLNVIIGIAFIDIYHSYRML